MTVRIPLNDHFGRLMLSFEFTWVKIRSNDVFIEILNGKCRDKYLQLQKLDVRFEIKYRFDTFLTLLWICYAWTMCASNILACKITSLFCFAALKIQNMVIITGNTRILKHFKHFVDSAIQFSRIVCLYKNMLSSVSAKCGLQY